MGDSVLQVNKRQYKPWFRIIMPKAVSNGTGVSPTWSKHPPLYNTFKVASKKL